MHMYDCIMENCTKEKQGTAITECQHESKPWDVNSVSVNVSFVIKIFFISLKCATLSVWTNFTIHIK